MSRANQATPPAGILLAILLAALMLPGAARASLELVINEIDYDQPATDDAEFIEILNTGGVAEGLGDLVLQLVDGGGPTIITTIELPTFSLGPGAYFVVCSDASKVPNCDLVTSLGTGFVEDGAPDAVRLFKTTGGVVIDTVSYEGDVAGFVETSGVSPGDNATDFFLGISRFPDGTDTNDNSADLSPRCVTPGLPNVAFTPDCRINATKVDTVPGGIGDPGETISYEIQVTTSGSATNVVLEDTIDADTTLVGSSLNISPLAANDAYDAVGNTLLEVGVTPSGDPAVVGTGGLFLNDADFLGDTFSLSTFDATSVHGGSVSVNANGSFTYLPPVGFTGTDTFTYTIVDTGGLTGTATVAITVTEMVWYVDNTAGSGGSGRSNDPFDSLAPLDSGGSADADDDSDDVIFVHTGSGTTGDGILLEAGQDLIGEGVALMVGTETLLAAGSRPTLSASSGNAIDLATDNTIRGLDIGATTGTAFAGSGVGTLTISDAAIGSGGGAFDIDTGILAVALDTIVSTSTTAGVDGIDFDSVGGTFDVSGLASLTGLMGDGVNIAGSTGSFSFASLAIETGAGAGLVAKGGGTLSITSAPIVIATGGPAVDLAGTTTGNVGGTSQWTFASLSSTTSATEGIKLDALTDPFAVTGTTSISDPSNEGIEIDGSSVAYNFVGGTTTITDAGGNGIDLDGLTGSFTLSSPGGGITFPTGTNDSHGVLIQNSDNVTIQGTATDCDPFGTTTTCFVISDAGTGAGTSSLTSTFEGFQGILADDSGDLTFRFLRVSGTGGQASGGGDEHGIFVSNPDDGSTVTITDNDIFSIKNDGVQVLTDNLTGVVTVDVSDNRITGTGGATGVETTDFGIDLDVDDGTSTGRFVATIDDNTITDVNSNGIGIAVFGDTGRGGAGLENRFGLDGNTIHDWDFDAIGIVIAENSRNIITIENSVLDGDVSPLGTTPGHGIKVDVATQDLTPGTDNDFNTSETDLTISGNGTTITDAGQEAIEIGNFGDDEPISTIDDFDTNAGTIKVLITDSLTVTGNGGQGLRVEAGLNGHIDLRVEGTGSSCPGTCTDFSGNDGGNDDVLVGVRSTGMRTIASYLADLRTTNEVRVESDNITFPTHEFGCDDDGVAPNTCLFHVDSAVTSAATIGDVLTENGVTFGAVDLSLSSGDVNVVDESAVPTAAP